MIENRDWIFDGIGAALIILLLTWAASRVANIFRLWRDGKKIYEWLELNTRDEPAKSHKSLSEISIGTRLPKERVREVCLQNRKTFISIDNPENYSVWRVEPQSVYEKRGIRIVG
jgi:hypothetical protein